MPGRLPALAASTPTPAPPHSHLAQEELGEGGCGPPSSRTASNRGLPTRYQGEPVGRYWVDRLTYMSYMLHICCCCLVAKSCPDSCNPMDSTLRFPRQEYWSGSGLSFPSPGGLPHPGVGAASPALIGRFFTAEPPGEAYIRYNLLRFLQTFK